VTIEINQLTKTYSNGLTALKGINLTIESGMFGLLGPNGAGKSTLMQILVTLMNATSGEVYVNSKRLSKNRKDIRSIIGYLPQDFRFFPKLRTWEFLEYAASMAGVLSKEDRQNMVEQMLNEVGLYEARNRFGNKLSGGMKRRLGIAQALIGYPKIVVVDEPTTGLDPEERIRFRNILNRLTKDEVIVILSTHIVGDISSSCNQMALINDGTLKFSGTPSDFIQQADGHVWNIEVKFDELESIKEKYQVITSVPSDKGYSLEVVTNDTLHPHDQKVKAITPNLEHAYVYFMENVKSHADD
jgi:ABC-type multidrug transport system ATPase subunit